MPFPWLAAAVFSMAGASVYGASKQANAAKDAASMQAASADKSLQLQKESYANADRILTPYSQEGAAARRMYNALLGVPTANAAPARPASAMGTGQPGSPDWQAYLQQNPDLQAYMDRNGFGKVGGSTVEEFLSNHWNTYGQREGRTLPTFADTPAPGMGPGAGGDQIAADREMAMSAFRASPYSTIARDSAQRGTNALFSTAAAMGRGVNSGKTMRAAADWNNTAQNNALVSYMGSLGGVADTGYNADSGRASGGQTFANNASNALAAQANAQAQGRLGAANAWANGLSNAAGFIGWGAGQMGGAPKGNALFYTPVNAQTTAAALPSAFNTLRSGGF